MLGSGSIPRRAEVNKVWGFPSHNSFPPNDCYFFHSPANRLHERIQVQCYRFGVKRRLGTCQIASSMWCRSREGRYGGHAWELHLRCQATLLLVPKREEQCTRSSPSPPLGRVVDIVFLPRRCSKAPILRLSTWTSTTSKTARRTTSSRIRTLTFPPPARARLKSLLPSIIPFRRTPPGNLPRDRWETRGRWTPWSSHCSRLWLCMPVMYSDLLQFSPSYSF